MDRRAGRKLWVGSRVGRGAKLSVQVQQRERPLRKASQSAKLARHDGY